VRAEVWAEAEKGQSPAETKRARNLHYYSDGLLGRFAPRVIMFPGGDAYYSRDLQPYPWAASRPAAVMPYAVD